jgi:hypothetical protein
MKFFLSLVAGLIGLTAAAPSPQVPTTGNIIRPSVRSQYYVSTGQIVYNTTVGLIQKTGTSSDITTLLTITIPAAAAGKVGNYHYALDSTAIITGSGQIDIFTSLKPAVASASTWPPGNQRNTEVGRIQAIKGGTATWIFGNPTFTIPAAGTYGYELVGVNTLDLVSYPAANNGIWISY